MTKAELRKLIREYVDEALTLSKQDDKLVVGSDLKSREERSSETFRSKDKLKKAGFKWNGEAWTISADEFDTARSTIMKLNKVETFVEKIEDLPELVMNAEDISKKQELATKIEGFIHNLTTELDEKAASDESGRLECGHSARGQGDSPGTGQGIRWPCECEEKDQGTVH